MLEYALKKEKLLLEVRKTIDTGTLIDQEADCLSQNPVLEHYENTDDFLKVVNLINLEDIKNDQQTNLDLQNRKIILENKIYYKKIKEEKKSYYQNNLKKL